MTTWNLDNILKNDYGIQLPSNRTSTSPYATSGGGFGGGGGGSWGTTGTSYAGPIKPAAPTTAPTNSSTPYGPTAPSRSPYTSAPAPTIAETLMQQATKLKGEVDAYAASQKGATTKGAYTAPTPETAPEWKSSNLSAKEEDAIRRAQLKMYQKEIDATNQIYDQMLREAQMQGQGRVGSTTAMGARAGILGSDFANSQRETILGYNRQVEGGVQAERSAKISSIMGLARKAAVDEIAAKNAARKADADSYIEYLKNKKTRTTENLAKLAGSLVLADIDPSTMEKTALDKIAKDYGVSVEDIIYSYQTKKEETDAAASKADLEKRKTESEIAKNGRVELAEGGALVDPVTGKVIYKNPKTYEPKDGGGAVTTATGAAAFVGQPNYAKLTVKQKNQADSLNNLIRSINEYKTYYSQNKGVFGGKAGNMFGGDAGKLETMFNSIIFAAAQAEGTGALQKPDREVIEKIIPNPTSISGAYNTLTKGGATANDERLQDQINKYTNNLRGYGLEPVLADPYEGGTAPTLADEVDSAGYDYAAMKADGLSDEEIIAALNGN